MLQIDLIHAHHASQTDGQFGDASGVPFGLVVAHVEGAYPAFQGGVVGLHQFHVGQLQFLKQVCVVYGDGGLSAQGAQKTQPFRIRVQRSAIEELQHPLELAASDERYPIVGDESLLLQQGNLPHLVGRSIKVGNDDNTPLERSPSGQALTQAERAGGEIGTPKAQSFRILQRLFVWIKQQDVSGVNSQLRCGLVKQHFQNDTEVQHGGDGHVDIVQGVEPLQLALRLLLGQLEVGRVPRDDDSVGDSPVFIVIGIVRHIHEPYAELGELKPVSVSHFVPGETPVQRRFHMGPEAVFAPHFSHLLADDFVLRLVVSLTVCLVGCLVAIVGADERHEVLRRVGNEFIPSPHLLHSLGRAGVAVARGRRLVLLA